MTVAPTGPPETQPGDGPAATASAARSTLGKRITTGVVLVAMCVAVGGLDEWLAPWFPCWFVLALLTTAKAALEISGLLAHTSARPSANTVLGGVLALVVVNWAPHVFALWEDTGPLSDDLLMHDPTNPITVFSWVMLVFSAILMLTFVVQSVQFIEPGRTMARISGTVLALAYVGLLGSFIIQHRWLGAPHEGLIALAALLATAKGSDTGAYTMGRIAGRHKLWPRLSPNKTIEGAAGGLLFGIGGALAVEAVARLVLPHPPLGWLGALGYGVVVGAAAQLGDLMESMIKRDCAQKDASDILPGFGGVLDVLDSLLFAGPVAYIYWVTFAI